jgi:hypothetical protein
MPERPSPTATRLIAILLLFLGVARLEQLWTTHVVCELTWDDGAVQLARDIHYYALGWPMYSDLRKPPYYALEYGPTVPLVLAPLTRLFGTDVFTCLRLGRGLTIAASFAVCLMMVLIARRFSSLPAAVIAVLGFVLTGVFFQSFSEFRVDMPALFMELSGLYATSLGLYPIALVLFVAAFMTKLTYVAGIVAAVGWSWWRGKRKRSLALAVSWLVLAGCTVIFVQLGNPFYLLNTFEAHVPLWDWLAPVQLLGSVGLAMLPLLLLAVVGFRRNSSTKGLELAYACAGLALGELSALRWAGGNNYFLELAAAVAILAAPGIDVVLAASSEFSRPGQLAAGVALAAILTLPAAVTRKMSLRSLFALKFRLSADSCVMPWDFSALRLLEQVNGPILAALPNVCLRLNERVWTPEFDVLNSMRSWGLFDDRQLIEMISSKRISAIALTADGLDQKYRGRREIWPQLREAIERNYVSLNPDALPYLMVPRP